MADSLLCDTCTLIDFIYGKSQVLHDLLANDMTLFVNSIIEMELLQGARNKNELRVNLNKRQNCFIRFFAMPRLTWL